MSASPSKELFCWFDRYTDPSRDGSREPNTGYGQLTRVGKDRGEGPVFVAEEEYRSAIAKLILSMERPLEKQP